MVDYFFDSYAIIELLKRNPEYTKYEGSAMVTTMFNKVEVAWWGLVNHDANLMRILLGSLSIVQETTDDIIADALLFRRKYTKRDISYADAIGYTYAQKNGLKFLTGDEQFRDLPGVEFVK